MAVVNTLPSGVVSCPEEGDERQSAFLYVFF